MTDHHNKPATTPAGMTVVAERPPEWIMAGCLDKFRVNVERTFWTYGDVIYNPGGIEIPDHIVAHEEQHMRQQAEYRMDEDLDMANMGALGTAEEPFQGKDAWWKQYLVDPRFRLEQEAEAYGAQYRFFCERQKDRNRRYRFLHELGAQLSGPLYQLPVSPAQARAMILVLSGERRLDQVAGDHHGEVGQA